MDNGSLAKAAIDNISLVTLAQQATSHLTWICLSPVSFFANLLIVVTVVFSKELRNKSHFIIVSYTVAELSQSLAYFGTGLARYMPYVYQVPYTANQLVCIVRQAPVTFGGNLVQIFSVVLGFDRLFCVGVPIKYSQLSLKKYIGCVNFFCWTYSFFRISLTFIDHDTNKLLPVCNTALAYSPVVTKATNPIGHVLVGTTASAYMAGAAVLYRRYRKANLVGDFQKSEWRRKVDFNVFVATAVVGFLYVITALVPYVLITITVYISSSLASIVDTALVVTSIYLANGISHLFVYLLVNRRFRENFLRVVCRREIGQTLVTPIL